MVSHERRHAVQLSLACETTSRYCIIPGGWVSVMSVSVADSSWPIRTLHTSVPCVILIQCIYSVVSFTASCLSLLNSLGTSAVVLGHLQALREAMEGLGGCDLAALSTSTTAILQLVEGTGNHSDTWRTKMQYTWSETVHIKWTVPHMRCPLKDLRICSP